VLESVGPQLRLVDLRASLLRGTMLAVAIMLVPAAAHALVEKEFVEPIVTQPAAGTEADFDADRLVYDPRTKIATASGAVRIIYGPYVLNATEVTFNEKTGEFKANGSVVLHEPNGNVMEAETLALRDKFKEVVASHVHALLTNNASIRARYAYRQADGISIFEQASYTACGSCETKSGAPLWELTSDETTHDQHEKMLHHVNPKLKIAGHTVMALPHWSQPDPSVKRKTGFLAPSIDHGRAYGIGVVVPYFIATAPNHDLTLRPKFTTKQGPVADVEWRHRLNSGQYNVRGYGVYQINPEEASDDSKLRGAVRASGAFEISDGWRWGFDGTATSDKEFLDDYDYDGREIAQSDVHVRGLWDRTYINAQALNFQSLSDQLSQDHLPSLPYVSGEHYFGEQVMGGELSFKWKSYSIWRDDPNSPFADVHHGTQQTRAVGDLRWTSQFISDAGIIVSPFAKVRSDVTYTENLPGSGGQDESISRVLPSAGFDVRYPFMASYGFGQSIISPVFQIIAATDETQTANIGNEDAITLNFDHSSLFLDDRFTGMDRFEGGTRINAGLTYSFLGANGGFVRASAGESFHVAGENSFVTGSGLEGSSSDLVAAVTVQPWDELSLTYEVRAEEDLSQINRQAAQASLTFDRISGNLGYLFINQEPAYGRLVDEEWLEADARVGLTEGWYLFGGMRYDIENNDVDYRTVGVEFDCDCMNFKLAYTGRDNDELNEVDHRVMMSIDFATLGGTKVSAGF
jgi:LPS-assembly protein